MRYTVGFSSTFEAFFDVADDGDGGAGGITESKDEKEDEDVSVDKLSVDMEGCTCGVNPPLLSRPRESISVPGLFPAKSR